MLPITLTIGLLLSIAGLAEPEFATMPEESAGESVDALAGSRRRRGQSWRKSDRELMRGVVEFGDKVVREVMTPRPEMFAVAGDDPR